MLLGLSILVGCNSSGAGGGGGSPPAPTATLTANPTSIILGQNSILTFTSTYADSGVMNNGEGAVGLNGQVTVSPTTTTTYTYTASGPGGSAMASATVTVIFPTVILKATPASIFTGQSFTLSWTSTNATSVYIASSVGNNVGPVPPNGSGTLSPIQTTTYTATATGMNNLQATATATVTVSPLGSFDGLLPDSTNAGNQDIDPNGAVGTRQFMEYVNTEFQAYDKITFLPVFSPPSGLSGLPVDTPWANPLNTTGGPVQECVANGLAITLDVVIIFDRLASRWVIAGKAFDGVESPYFCIAVSNTDDASSSSFGWYAYAYPLESVLGQNPGGTYYIPDWPKLGTWPDAYYASMDVLYDNQTPVESGVAVCALDRNNMLNGNATQSPQCIEVTSPLSPPNPPPNTLGVYLGHSLIPADFDGTAPPPANRDEFLVSIENPVNDGSTTTSTTFNLWDFHLDWTGNSTLTPTSVSVTSYTPGCYLFVPGSPAITNCVNEPQYQGNGEHVDSVGDRFMPRFDYRNFGAYESFLISNTVQTGISSGPNPLQTGVNWYELRDSGSGTPSVFQSGIINPDALLFRFLPSIAQDSAGNAAVGYSVSYTFANPGINFSYWSLATTNAPATELSILSGAGEEVTPNTGSGKWGSYSSMTVDPSDDCTFWYVNEYWPTDSAWATRIAFFKLPTCQ
jgi:hypothetical protein